MVVDTQNEHINSILQKHNFRKVRDNEWHYTVISTVRYGTFEYSLVVKIGDHIIIERNGIRVLVTDSLRELNLFLYNTLYMIPPISSTECVV